jgi:hypothetical protein
MKSKAKANPRCGFFRRYFLSDSSQICDLEGAITETKGLDRQGETSISRTAHAVDAPAFIAQHSNK